MKNKIMLATIMAFMSCILLTACKPQYYTEQLLSDVREEYTAKGEKWFENNLPEATVNEMSLVCDYTYLHNLLYGNFDYEGETYYYNLNSDEGVLYVDRNYALVEQKAKDIITQAIDFDYTDIEIMTLPEYEISCTMIYNMTSGINPHETEIKYKDVAIFGPYFPFDYTAQEVDEWVLEKLKTHSEIERQNFLLYIYVTDYSYIEAGNNMYELLLQYPGIHTVYFYSEELSDQEYYGINYENKNQIVHYYRDAEDKWSYEYIKY